MRLVSIREFRARLAEMVGGRSPVLITRHAEHVAVVYPLRDPKKVPPEVRRRIFFDVTASLARDLDTEEESGPVVADPVVERYKRDVDRTLIRENLRRTPEERLNALAALQRLAEEARRAAPRRAR